MLYLSPPPIFSFFVTSRSAFQIAGFPLPALFLVAKPRAMGAAFSQILSFVSVQKLSWADLPRSAWELRPTSESPRRTGLGEVLPTSSSGRRRRRLLPAAKPPPLPGSDEARDGHSHRHRRPSCQPPQGPDDFQIGRAHV